MTMAQINISMEPRGQFDFILDEANVGDELIYCIGPNSVGRHRKDAYSAFEAGRCVLYQRRLGPMMFSYIAKKIKQ
jgi:hypothetical protein